MIQIPIKNKTSNFFLQNLRLTPRLNLNKSLSLQKWIYRPAEKAAGWSKLVMT